MTRSTLTPMEGRLRTKCSECQTEFYAGLSIAMQCGVNSGHGSCLKCKTFLHIEILEGDEAWTEPYDAFLKRTAPDHS